MKTLVFTYKVPIVLKEDPGDNPIDSDTLDLYRAEADIILATQNVDPEISIEDGEASSLESGCGRRCSCGRGQ